MKDKVTQFIFRQLAKVEDLIAYIARGGKPDHRQFKITIKNKDE